MPRSNRRQLPLPFSAIHNSELFSNHWLTNRLPLEPEWRELRDPASEALAELLELWRSQRDRVEHYGGEQALEQAFIQPVLQILGWKLIYQTHLRGRKPDYALFISDKELDLSLATGRLNAEFWKHPAVLADAKAWHVSLDRPRIVDQQREYPPEQIEWYLNNSELSYAILTNGRIWRLIPRRHMPGERRFQTFLGCDLAKLLNDRINQTETLFNVWQGFDDFFRFFLFFSPTAFQETIDRHSLIQRARQGSSEYRLGVGEGLKQRVFEALRLCIEGFLSHAPNDLAPEHDLEKCKIESLNILYRLLFVLFAEDRKLLPYKVDRAYTDNRSLGRFRDEIAARLDRIEEGHGVDFPNDECTLWTDLMSLFDLIDKGAGRYKVPAYNGGLFDQDHHSFLAQKSLPDRYLARVIDQLGRAVDPQHPLAGPVRVDYRDLAIQHLGNVYEGLLELRPHFADEEMVVIRNKLSERHEETIVQLTSAIPNGYEYTDQRYAQGSIYLLTDKGERRMSGSYYTPGNIVDYIVERTLGPICEEIDRDLQQRVGAPKAKSDSVNDTTHEARSERLLGDFPSRVLNIRVLDPAMGSGHFLIRACQYLAEQIATNPNTKDPVNEHLPGDESTLSFWKRRVAESCLYGVDKNAMAVELAKLALWLETVSIDQPLTFLDHHLRHGDSIVGAFVAGLRSLPDAPPLLSNLYEEEIKRNLPSLLTALDQIGHIPSASVNQVKEKEKLFRKKVELVRKPFRQVADIWCSTFFVPEQNRIQLKEYETAIKLLGQPVRLASLLELEPYRLAAQVGGPAGIAPFHWELEFPEALFSNLNDPSECGFDAVIGNPPYDVLAEKEIGHSVSHLKAFLEHSQIYKPSFVGKNNLYKLFVCRALNLLTDEGRLGFIVPMAILGDEQASGIRREVLRAGGFTDVQAFPQKDNPSKRVFRDAKLSTAVVLLQKKPTDEHACPFALRVNPANEIDTASSLLRLTSADIPMYDPENMTITPCSQSDWDLAVRIMQSGRFQRLGDVCKSYQGEVNETSDKCALSEDSVIGPQVLRGANVSLYALREASQGKDKYLDESIFLQGKSSNSKAFHGKLDRIGFQRSSPQNNFRRLIACFIPEAHYCFDTVSYIIASESRLPLPFVLTLLNSKLIDWYFRLGSTNSKVNEYQFNILPSPIFSEVWSKEGRLINSKVSKSLDQGEVERAYNTLLPCLGQRPFPLVLQRALIHATQSIITHEQARGDISRNERSSLSVESQPFQDFIDQMLFKMAGLADGEIRSLEQRLAGML